MTQKQDNLESFAKRIATRVKAGGNTDSMERLIARLLTGEDVKVAAIMAAKWVEWMYGKAKETHEHTGKVQVEMTVSDADCIIRDYFSVAASRTIETSASHQGQATQQNRELLPS